MARSEFPGRDDRALAPPLGDLLPEQQRSGASISTDQAWQHNGSKGPNREAAQARQAARALGWFSLGIGISELAMAGIVGRMAGLNGSRGILRVLGAREIASGLGILSGHRPSAWVWSRVLGDVIDLAVLGKAATSPYANRTRIAAAAAAVAGVTAVDILTGQQLSRLGAEAEPDRAVHVRKSFQINRPAQELYRFWRDFTNLPRIMQHLESVETIEGKHSRWTAKGPAGTRIRWEAEITEDRPGEIIAWRSIEGSMVDNWGSVKFINAPGGRGSIVAVELHYSPPAGAVGAAVARLLGEEPLIQLDEDLRRLKQIMEAGEAITTEGQPAGRARSTSWKYDYAGRRIAAAL